MDAAQRILRAEASPSLALMKYWGKGNEKKNIPATTSIAMTLSPVLHTRVELRSSEYDKLRIDGADRNLGRYGPFLEFLRARLRVSERLDLSFTGTVPPAAGLAGSSASFAALTVAAAALSDIPFDLKTLSAIARRGSASAARAVFGGFTRLRAGARHAEVLFPPAHWEKLRVIAVLTDEAQKAVSSREAMNAAKQSSPYYASWLRSSRRVEGDFCDALRRCDIEKLGTLARASYLQMFATMISTQPPVLYWNAASVTLIHRIAELRQQGIPAWETMDAGPQVKILTLEPYVARICDVLREEMPDARVVTAGCGEGARMHS